MKHLWGNGMTQESLTPTADNTLLTPLSSLSPWSLHSNSPSDGTPVQSSEVVWLERPWTDWIDWPDSGLHNKAGVIIKEVIVPWVFQGLHLSVAVGAGQLAKDKDKQKHSRHSPCDRARPILARLGIITNILTTVHWCISYRVRHCMHKKYMMHIISCNFRASFVVQAVKNLPALWEIRAQSLGQDYPLEKRMATNPSILVWRIMLSEKPGGLQSIGLQRVGHNWAAYTLTWRAIVKNPTSMLLSFPDEKTVPQKGSITFPSPQPNQEIWTQGHLNPKLYSHSLQDVASSVQMAEHFVLSHFMENVLIYTQSKTILFLIAFKIIQTGKYMLIV